VSHNGINATLTSDMTPETVTLEQAVGLLEAKAARGGTAKSVGRLSPQPRRTARKAKRQKTPAAQAKPAAAREKKPARKSKAGGGVGKIV
jgi:DNA topoisomerase-1